MAKATSGFHVTTPSPSTERYVRTMPLALNKAGITPDQVGYINAHATSTLAGDVNEPKTIHKLFGSHTQSAAASPIKPMHLHIRPRTKTQTPPGWFSFAQSTQPKQKRQQINKT